MNNLVTTDYRSVIERAATDPSFDVDKLERLVAMQEASEQRHAEIGETRVELIVQPTDGATPIINSTRRYRRPKPR